jgi:hypothetical protein
MIKASEDQFKITEDLSQALSNEQAYLVYFDPSPMLPSVLLKNYLVKLNH